ncbi:MAG: hypothetical protein OXJ54_05640 [Gemmatimonadetes bacterium]|nr:hypothetical protein [Candidatus Palauibacter rhopaloidicola]
MDLEAETLVFSRIVEPANRDPATSREKSPSRRYTVDDIFTPHDPGPWPEGFLCSREELYGDDGR